MKKLMDFLKRVKAFMKNLTPQVENNHQAQVHIFKDFHKNIIGKGGITIKKVYKILLMN